MKRFALISNYTRNEWNDLKGKIITNDTVMISRLGDYHPYNPSPVIKCKTLLLHNCNKNFVYYWLRDRTFPKLETVYLNSHPCEPDLLRSFSTKKYTTYIHERYNGYYTRWLMFNGLAGNVEIISSDNYQKMLEQLIQDNEEPLKFKHN